MKITCYSFLSTVIWYSLFILLTYFLRKCSRKKRQPVSISVPVALYVLAMLRTVLPLDFPHAVVLPDSWLYPKLYRWITAERFAVGGWPVSIVTVLVLVWVTGACVAFCRYVSVYAQTIRDIWAHVEPAGETEQRVLREILRAEKKPVSVAVYSTPAVDMPYGVGVFRKAILLPEATYTEEELYYILKHEYTHFRNHDILFKQIIVLFCIVFWWNPVSRLLKQDLEQAVEIRCDMTVTKHMKREEKIAYLSTITNVLRKEASRAVPLYGSTALSRQDPTGLRERFAIILGPEKSVIVNVKNVAVVVLFVLLMVLSYATILQPHIDAPTSVGSNAVDIDSSNTYILHQQDGEYWLYRQDCQPKLISKEIVELLINEGFDVYEE